MNIGENKIIRDFLHGDIEMDHRFISLINTKEFQRLRRIHQLSVANMIFPSANHTRFSHSIGTYHLMSKIIKRIENMDIDISNEDKDLALVVALLHDIGHGPFSHAIEAVIGKNHEIWTTEIIQGETDINKVIIKKFGNEFPKKISDIILGNNTNYKDKGIDLFFVLKFLISSQLDSDRLDYIVRDSKQVGVNFGNLDLERIIKGIRVTEYKDKIYTCILEKNITDIENYLVSRYNMYEIVYLNPIKCEYEKIISLIFDRINEIKNDIEVPKNISKILSKNITIKEYIDIDDYDIVSEFKSLIYSNDFILSKLCRCIIYREKFDRIDILNNKEEEIQRFKKALLGIIKKYSSKFTDNLSYAFITFSYENIMYKKSKENIYVLKNNGVVVDIDDLLNCSHRKKIINFNFICKDILLDYIDKDKKDSFNKELDLLISKFDNRNFIEIERKFLLNEKISEEKIINTIKNFNSNTTFSKVKIKNYLDEYYDCDDSILNDKMSLRIRLDKDNSKKVFTLKKPTEDEAGRFEYEEELLEDVELRDAIKPYLEKEINSLEKKLIVKNQKRKYDICIDKAEYEISIDTFTYDKNEEIYKELEIELKSDYYHKVKLKELSDYLSKKLELKENKDSKYKRGMELKKGVLNDE